MNTGRLLALILILELLPTAAAAAPLAGPCVPGATYDSACDANQDGSITVTDVQLTAGHWNQTGAYVSDNNHNHLGQTWTGSNNPLTLTGAYGAPDYAPLVLNNNAGNGIRIQSAGNNGLFVESADTGVRVDSAYNGMYVFSSYYGVTVNSANYDGVHIGRAGSPSTQTSSSYNNGMEVQGAQGHGLYVGRADNTGVWVDSAGNDGVHIARAGSPSTAASSAAANGVEVEGAQNAGVYVGHADGDGVSVQSAGGFGVAVYDSSASGVAVGTAATYGVSVGQAGWDGIYVSAANSDGIHVNTADDDGIEVGWTGHNGLLVISAGSNGVDVNSSAYHGVYVNNAGFDGVAVNWASFNGVYVNSAGVDGVYADTRNGSGQWGFYTPDRIFGTLGMFSAVSLVAQVSDSGQLTAGDLVAVAGLAGPLAGSTVHVPLVRLADDNFTGVIGIVESRLALTPQPGRPLANTGQAETRMAVSELRTAEGPARPGDYVAITVLGAAQVKVDGAAVIEAGQRLTVSASPGHVRALRSKDFDGMLVTEGAPVIGVALEAAKDGLVWVMVNPQ